MADVLTLRTLHVPPFSQAPQGDEGPDGILVTLVQRTLSFMGIRSRVIVSSWPEALQAIQAGQADAVFPCMESPDRRKWLRFPSTPLTRFRMALFAQRYQKAPPWNGNMESLSGLTIGRIRLARVAPLFDRAAESDLFTVSEWDEPDDMVTALADGKLDLIAFENVMVRYSAKHQGVYGRLRQLDPLLAKAPVYLAFSRQRTDAALTQQFDATLNRLLAQGAFDALVQRWIR
ncbi:putative amino acid ABC transporter periplasmic protein [Magnetofaba australis IT-1]|uniref:Putative amino acid ABC transporter periplasmic protein n=1 Tax=Magnetofaba australis IT-1 TaxID=1434232 RepID=A0A1Y2K257_9PROT|nr:putative amino acid ABC transporter periplasmic protein [Magnetofaba australis IT-1]